jgi:ribosomal protein L37E
MNRNHDENDPTPLRPVAGTDARGSALAACDECGSRLKSWNGRAWYCRACGAPSDPPARHRTAAEAHLTLAQAAALIAARLREAN